MKLLLISAVIQTVNCTYGHGHSFHLVRSIPAVDDQAAAAQVLLLPHSGLGIHCDDQRGHLARLGVNRTF